MALYTSGRPIASTCVSTDIDMCLVDPSDPCSSVAECVAVTVSMSGHRKTVVGAYVRPNTHLNYQDISAIRANCPRRFVFCSDSNAYQTS